MAIHPRSSDHPRSFDETVRGRRIVGFALVGSAVLFVLAAALFYAGVIPLAPESRPLVAAVLVLAGLVDAVMGARFLSAASTK